MGSFAVDAMWLGDVDRDGAESPTAWEYFGVDLDGSQDGLPTCIPSGSGYLQGPMGQDNRLGQIFEGFGFDGATLAQDSAIKAGRFSILISLQGATGTLSVCESVGPPPKLDGTDAWTPWPDASPPVLYSLTAELSDVAVSGEHLRAHADGPFAIWLYAHLGDTSPRVFVVARRITLLADLTADGTTS